MRSLKLYLRPIKYEQLSQNQSHLVYFLDMQLKYHDTGREKDCLPRVGQWNMMNKVFQHIAVLH